MGSTILEKILGRASGSATVSPGEIIIVDIDCTILLDVSFHFIQHGLGGREILRVADPKKIAVIFDHGVPAPDASTAAMHIAGREFVKRFGIEHFHDVGYDHGISHVVVADKAYALPGSVLLGGDSHTCSAGAFNCAARAVSSPDILHAMTTGKTWFRVSETVRYDLEGTLRPGVSMKDVFLHIAGTFGHHVNQCLEFGGPGIAALSINARRTLTTMCAELSADFAIFEADQRLLDYVHQRNAAPFTPVQPDPNAHYEDRRTLHLDRIEPLVGLPDAVVNNSAPVTQVAGTPIHQAFVGSCANGTLDDLKIAANAVAGKRIPAGVRFIVTPGSQEIWRQAMAEGYVQKLVEAGAVVTNATCGACFGGHMGVLGPGETCITASTRNFKGRMGHPSARIYMASPATVAASALAGRIALPDAFTNGGAS